MTLPELVDAMEEAGTVDLRAHAGAAAGAAGDRAARRTRGCARPSSCSQRGGARAAHRIDRDRDGAYEHADAIRIMDAWWPLLGAGRVQADAGQAALSSQLLATTQLDNAPNNHGEHLGSAYQGGWYGYVAQGPAHRARTQGQGPLLAALLRRRQAQEVPHARCARRCGRRFGRPRAALYGATRSARTRARPATSTCFDAVRFRPVGGATQPLIPGSTGRPTSRSTRSRAAAAECSA